MSNHLHLLLEPDRAEELPKIMHWLNWYAAMCFNRLLKRTGHFWGKRYHSTGFPNTDLRRALNTLRYIHANPKAAGMQQGFFYDFSNYGMHDRLTDDGLPQWHPAFLQLGKTLEECAAKYRKFCQSYRPQPKTERRSHWGNKLLAGMKSLRKGAKGQMHLPWDDWDDSNPEISEVAERFVRANALNPEIALEKMTRCQVSEPEKADETVETAEEKSD